MRWLKKLFPTPTKDVELKVVEEIDEPLKMGSFEANEKVRNELFRLGDDGKVSRHVRHFVYEGSLGKKYTDDAEDIAQRLRDLGYSTHPSDNGGIRFENYTEVASKAFDAGTEMLYKLAEESGWHYDGWECAVIQKTEGVTE